MRLRKFYHEFHKEYFYTPCVYIRVDNPIYMRRNLLIAISVFWFSLAWSFERAEE